jgi:hypothetical protein
MGAHWWLFLVWPSILLAIVFISIATDGRLIILVAWIKLWLLFALLLCATFPQIRAQLGIDKLGYLITPTEVSETVNESRDNLKKLRVNELKADAEVVRQATATPPYRNLPPEYRAFRDAGWKKTLREIVEELNSIAQVSGNGAGKPIPPANCPDCFQVRYSAPDKDGIIGVTTTAKMVGKKLVFHNMWYSATKYHGVITPMGYDINYMKEVPSTGTLSLLPVGLPPVILWGRVEKIPKK